MSIKYDKLRTLMDEKGILFGDLQSAKICGWNTISNINSNKYITLETLERIAKHLDCEIGDLVEIEKD